MSLPVQTAGPGRLWTRRIGGVDLRAPEVKTMMLRSISASSDRVRRWVAPRGQGGAQGCIVGARGWLAAVFLSGVAMAASAMRGKSKGVRGREQGGKGADEGVPGGCRGILSRSGAGRQAGGGSGACVRAAATRSSFCPRTKTTGEGSGDGLGQQGGSWAGWWAARVRPGKVLLFFILFLF